MPLSPTAAPIYLDYNATTPIARPVADAMLPFLYGHFGNPSSSHPYGAEAKQAVAQARAEMAALLHCTAAEVVFTSGGTESNNLAIKGMAVARRDRGRHLITSAVEHPAVLAVCHWLASQGFRLTVLPVDGQGRVDPADLEAACTAETTLVTVMHANNEVGTIQPIAALAEIAHRHGALFHTDAAQTVGKIPVDVQALGVDLLTVAGHKLYAPKGVGALYIRNGLTPANLMHGAGHEGGRRPGTENVLQMAGLGAAAALGRTHLGTHQAHLQAQRDRLQAALTEALPAGAFRINGDPEARLPNTLSISFYGVPANTLLDEIGDRVAASAGAACHAEADEVSGVLAAMGVPVSWAMGTVRFSTGRETTTDEIDRAATLVAQAVQRLQPTINDAPPPPDTGEAVRLTRFTHGLGCACKLRPQALEALLQALPPLTDPAVLVGPETADDAAVYQLTDDLALVHTADFFTPVVDDPYAFGAIAAANALSDLYAMGATPRYGLNLCGFPSQRLPMAALQAILAGAYDTAAQAGLSIVGGHTVETTEPLFGLAVTGTIHPQDLWRNSTARPGDALILTKPLGTGILATAAKRGLASPADVALMTTLMTTLNRAAAQAARTVGIHACTDVTGFGLLGHLREMAIASGVDVRLHAPAIPVLPAALAFASADVVPGGTQQNLAYVAPMVDFSDAIGQPQRLLLADAQTSGGLLFSLPADRADALLAALAEAGVSGAARIGEMTEAGKGRIAVV